MGVWGTNPWDNDSAADWFGDMFESTKLAEHVERTLESDAEECHEEIRAAAHVLALMCRTYIWPVDDIDRHLALGVARLTEIQKLGIYEEPEFAEALSTEIAALTERQRAERPRS